jgi:hypothetical protein
LGPTPIRRHTDPASLAGEDVDPGRGDGVETAVPFALAGAFAQRLVADRNLGAAKVVRFLDGWMQEQVEVGGIDITIGQDAGCAQRRERRQHGCLPGAALAADHC